MSNEIVKYTGGRVAVTVLDKGVPAVRETNEFIEALGGYPDFAAKLSDRDYATYLVALLAENMPSDAGGGRANNFPGQG